MRKLGLLSVLLWSAGSILSAEVNRISIIPLQYVDGIGIELYSLEGWMLLVHPNTEDNLVLKPGDNLVLKPSNNLWWGSSGIPQATIGNHVFDFKDLYHQLARAVVETQPREPAATVSFSARYDLNLLSVEGPNDLPEAGRCLTIVALIGTDLHIRTFDHNGEQVVDMPENELLGGERLSRLKQRLMNPRPAELSELEKQGIIRDAISISGPRSHFTTRTQTVYLTDEEIINNVFRLAIENALCSAGEEQFHRLLRSNPPTPALAGVRPRPYRTLLQELGMEEGTKQGLLTPSTSSNQGNPRPPFQLRKSPETKPALGPKPGTSNWSNTLLYGLLAVIAIAAFATVLILKARRQ